MKPIIMKFGGTSVADAAAIRQVVRIVADNAAAGAPVVVVVSAMAGVTNDLFALCDLAPSGDLAAVERALSAIQRRHRTSIEDLAAEKPDAFEDVRDAIADECDQLRTVLGSLGVLREATARAVARVVSAGELMSSRIVAGALLAADLDAQWVDAREIVITDDAHPAAPVMEAIRERAPRLLRPVHKRGAIAVVGGYIGATSAGIATTLGRGGSDFSASLLGAAIDASEIQIWTDVDGMLTADPRIVEGARPVRHLSFNEAAELAYFGAKVLHPSTILPAVERDIPVRILNTMHPDSPGSVISAGPRERRETLAAIACKRNITVIDVTSSRMLQAHGFLRGVFEVFDRHRTSIDVVTTSEVSISMSVDDDRRLEAIEQDLRAFGDVHIDRRMAIVSAVGDALLRDSTIAARVIGALEGIPLRMVSQAASRRNLTVVLDEGAVGQAMTRLYEEFFTTVEAAS
ncbi:MAG: aspartate kinase [Vicinamibacterales bacterium]